ncbi:uncharacterized protein LY89DRAFT_783561 [Mollisia scopiformis]|uniref:Uncharacterized protein n=1 Tax=Mollisia scopiformis TaxID=149040 RepID=A0A194X6H2_MOLSC|nr:uncharacterized protein LY89DRAFT_783561 [Mollisia scopiformis]KUJ15407.1 hypothetical protein LY89DRAFT_783561 [Mollisia scopiformis]
MPLSPASTHITHGTSTESPPDNSSACTSNSNLKSSLAKNITSLPLPTSTNDSTLPDPNIRTSPSLLIVLPTSRTISERQKLCSGRVNSYFADPIHTLPQYKRNTIQAGMKDHVEDMLSQVEALTMKINEDDA